MVNYALGGASEYAPKNTLSAFYTALIMGAGGLKTEIRLSNDRTAVLFSDEHLEILTDAGGKTENYTAAQLKYFKVKGKNGFFDKIITLDEFLSVFSVYNISFLLDLTVPDADEQVLSLINKYKVVKNTVIASAKLEYLKNVRRKCDYVKLGLIIGNQENIDTQALKENGISVVCQDAEFLTAQSLELLKKYGFDVYAHNVTDTELLKKVCLCGADAVITGFPDKVSKYTKEK